MQTSAIGRAERAGFTLVELMVVLVIVGLMSAAVVVAVPDGRPSLAAEAERFGARLLRAREEAVLTNRAVLVTIDEEGYGFQMRRRGAWSPMEPPFARTAWGEETSIVNAQDDETVSIGFDVTGAAEPVSVTLQRQAGRVTVAVTDAGEVRIDAAG